MNEKEYAIREAAVNKAGEDYFEAHHKVVEQRKAFEAGFIRGWDAALAELAKAYPKGEPK